jgi:hypothetical protein
MSLRPFLWLNRRSSAAIFYLLVLTMLFSTSGAPLEPGFAASQKQYLLEFASDGAKVHKT